MLGVTGPTLSPVSRSRALRLNVLYFSSFASAAAAVAGLVFGLRLLFPAGLHVPRLLLALIFAVLAACDLRLGPLRTPGRQRQTCPAWRRRFGIPRATVLWGLDIGTTVSTIKVTSLYWASLVVLISMTPPRPELAVIFFAAGYLLAHLAGVWRIFHGARLTDALAGAGPLAARVRVTGGIVLAALAVVICGLAA